MNLIIVNNGDCTCPDCAAYEVRHGRRWNNTTRTYAPVPHPHTLEPAVWETP